MSEQIEYEINYACEKLESFANNNMLNDEYIKYIYTITAAARKWAKIKEALL